MVNASASRRSALAMLALLSTAELLGMSPWFSASAVTPLLQDQWGLSAFQAGWLTTIVALGFVAGTATAALLNLADLVPVRAYFAVSAIGAALANLGLLAAPGFHVALATRFLTGFFLAGVYPPGMKMISTWSKASRGIAIGTLIGALTVGKAMPYLIHAFPGASVAVVVAATSGAAALAALLVASFYRTGPHPFPKRPFSWGLVAAVWADRRTRLAIGGYLGHMWELYAMWTWLPAFLAASLAASPRSAPAWVPELLGFVGISAGGVGCVWGGWAARRLGYARVVTIAMAASAACAVLSALCFGGPLALVAALAAVWGFFVVADSAQFSAMVSESAPPYAVGTALTLQTSMGFLLTMATIQLVPVLAQWAGWRWAFPALALGPALGIAAIARLGEGARSPARAAPDRRAARS